jgi:hypothetical protein
MASVTITKASKIAEWTAFLTTSIPSAAITESGASVQNMIVSGVAISNIT